MNTNQFVSSMEEIDLPVKEIIANSIAAYDEHVDLEHFAYDVTALLVTILHDKAKLSDCTTQLLRTVKMQSVRAANEKYLLVRSRGCGLCGTPLSVTSGNVSRDSFGIVFLDQPGEITPDDFAVTCKPCAEKYNLAHIDADVAQLRTHNRTLKAAETIDAGLAPLGLDEKIIALLIVINQLPLESITPDTIYDVLPLTEKLDDRALLRSCRDAMATYAPVAELLDVYAPTASLTSSAGEPKQVFFSFDATKAYGSKAEEVVARTQVIHLNDDAEALYGFTWNTEPDNLHTEGEDPQ
ncbi:MULTISPECIES: hypothetical protein [unclassified Corynebacterium]|uniref:hypothetical protein n=1 Tax=unclassified Corynebacterium TaxID=2624378 RepID=UPI001D0F0065|nr:MULTISPECIES: hypothetical protein [unclassified Corynebacterium]